MSTVSPETRRELVTAIRDRYLASSASDKQRILDEFVALTGYHRKHAIRVLRSSTPEPPVRPPRSRIYDEAVREALVVLWEASDRICGKRLKPLLPVLLAALEKHGHVSLDADVRARLLAWRTRRDPFEAVWPRMVTWLETEPERTAKELLERLRAEGAEFSDGHLRTLQRRVKEWRSLAARRLVFATPVPSLQPGSSLGA